MTSKTGKISILHSLWGVLKTSWDDPIKKALEELGEPPDFASYKYDVFAQKKELDCIRFDKTYMNEEEADYDLFRAVADSSPRQYLPWLLGRNSKGEREFIELRGQHILVAGSTGSGKTTQLNSAVINLLHFTHPEYLKLVVFDPKNSGFSAIKKVSNFAQEHDEIKGCIHKLSEELSKRIAVIKRHRVRDVDAINTHAYRTRSRRSVMPYIVIIFDEIPEFLKRCKNQNDTETIDLVDRLTSLGRGCGFQFVFSTQSPYSKFIQGDIKNNLTQRVAFALGDNQHDLMTLGSRRKDEPSATTLDRGAFIVKRKGAREVFNSIYCSYESLQQAVDNWKQGGWDWRLWKR